MREYPLRYAGTDRIKKSHYSMFFALSQNYQYYAYYRKLSKELKNRTQNSIKLYVDQTVLELLIKKKTKTKTKTKTKQNKTKQNKTFFDCLLETTWPAKILVALLSSLDNLLLDSNSNIYLNVLISFLTSLRRKPDRARFHFAAFQPPLKARYHNSVSIMIYIY